MIGLAEFNADIDASWLTPAYHCLPIFRKFMCWIYSYTSGVFCYVYNRLRVVSLLQGCEWWINPRCSMKTKFSSWPPPARHGISSNSVIEFCRFVSPLCLLVLTSSSKLTSFITLIIYLHDTTIQGSGGWGQLLPRTQPVECVLWWISLASRWGRWKVWYLVNKLGPASSAWGFVSTVTLGPSDRALM